MGLKFWSLKVAVVIHCIYFPCRQAFGRKAWLEFLTCEYMILLKLYFYERLYSYIKFGVFFILSRKISGQDSETLFDECEW